MERGFSLIFNRGFMLMDPRYLRAIFQNTN